jgi:hypothetical protein
MKSECFRDASRGVRFASKVGSVSRRAWYGRPDGSDDKMVAIGSVAVSPAGWWGCAVGSRSGTATSENSISSCFSRMSCWLASLLVRLAIGSQPRLLRDSRKVARPSCCAVAVLRAKLCHIDYTAVPIDPHYDSVSFALLPVVEGECWQWMRVIGPLQATSCASYCRQSMKLARHSDVLDCFSWQRS